MRSISIPRARRRMSAGLIRSPRSQAARTKKQRANESSAETLPRRWLLWLCAKNHEASVVIAGFCHRRHNSRLFFPLERASRKPQGPGHISKPEYKSPPPLSTDCVKPVPPSAGEHRSFRTFTASSPSLPPFNTSFEFPSLVTAFTITAPSLFDRRSSCLFVLALSLVAAHATVVQHSIPPPSVPPPSSRCQHRN